MKPWTDTDHVKFQLFFFLRSCLDFDLIIATAELLVVVSCWRCTKTIRTVHAKVICSFMGCIQRLKHSSSWFLCNVYFFLSPNINKLAYLLQFPLSTDLRAVYILFLLLNSTFTAITYQFFVLLVETPAHLSCTDFYVVALNMHSGLFPISSSCNAAITAHFKHFYRFLFITAFFFVIHYSNSIEELPRVSAKLWKLMCEFMLRSIVKHLSEIREFPTCVFICANIFCISFSRSLSLKNSAVKLLNDISTLIQSNLLIYYFKFIQKQVIVMSLITIY